MLFIFQLLIVLLIGSSNGKFVFRTFFLLKFSATYRKRHSPDDLQSITLLTCFRLIVCVVIDCRL
jgi:hypothetical protein